MILKCKGREFLLPFVNMRTQKFNWQENTNSSVRYKIVTIITTWNLKIGGKYWAKKLQFFRRGEGSEELFFFFERGNIINHVHEFTEITGTLKILKNWLIKVWTKIKTYTPYIQDWKSKMSLLHVFPLKLKGEICFSTKKSP